MKNKKGKNLKVHLSTKDRLNFFMDLATMLQAGIPIIEAIESMEDDSTRNLKQILTYIRKALYNGESLSDILTKMPYAFDAITINLIKAAEAGGTLETTLQDIVETAKKDLAFTSQLRNTMIYPIFVMVVFTGIVILMLTFVLPRISKIFESLNVKIPTVTKVMIKASNIFTADWPFIIAILAAIIVGLFFVVRSNKKFLIRLLLSLPFLKKLGTNIDLTRFTRSFGLLMRSGVPILEALELSENVIQKKVIIDMIEDMKRDITAGRPLATSMPKYRKTIPSMMSRSIRTAETSGTLEQTLQNLAVYFDTQVSETLKVLGGMVEPMLIILVGILVGTLMISIIGPIYSMISQINSAA